MMAHEKGPIRYLLNGRERVIEGVKPTTTILEHLRRAERLTGTKEGCAEGDCGACTVMLSEPDGEGGIRRRAVNACIQFVPALHGRSVETIEAIGGGGLAPVQAAMVDTHASQCGFCTPGFAMQLHVGWLNGEISDRQSVKDLVSGNLCRCTGYGPIMDAGLSLAGRAPPLDAAADAALAERLAALGGEAMLAYEAAGGRWFAPRDVDELADTYAAHPEAVLISGATDVGLWVTKGQRELPLLIDVSRVWDLRQVEEAPGRTIFGAGVSHAAAIPALTRIHPDLGEVMRRFAGHQIRAMGTVGGNIANGSPIGDLAPCFIALGAGLHLRMGDSMRGVRLEDFFIEYGRQDRRPGEFVAAIDVPDLGTNEVFFARKISKRFDSDISAVMAAFRLRIEAGVVTDAALAFGGMAGTPKRAKAAEAALIGQAFVAEAASRAAAALAQDFAPLTDMRASSRYRLEAAGNLVRRFAHEHESGRVDLFAVTAEVA